jgi:hypothetical protein
MKHPATFVLIAAILAGCSKPTTPADSSTPGKTETSAPPSEYPTLVIDEQHQILSKETPPVYQIVAAAGIRLDATQFHFTYGTNAVTPNMVQFVGGQSVYRLARPTETNVYVIDHTTLAAVKGGAFRGFRSGDRVMFAIGRSTRGPDKEDFWVSWAGQIEVK